MDFQTAYEEFPIVICDAEGVVDRVATVGEAEEYVDSMPNERLSFYDSREEPATEREP